MILHAYAIATVVGVAAVAFVVTEPCAEFEQQAAQPFVLELRKRIDAEITIKVATRILEAAEPVVALADASHGHRETADAPGNADATEGAIVPAEIDALAGAAGIHAHIACHQVILALYASGARALARNSGGAGGRN